LQWLSVRAPCTPVPRRDHRLRDRAEPRLTARPRRRWHGGGTRQIWKSLTPGRQKVPQGALRAPAWKRRPAGQVYRASSRLRGPIYGALARGQVDCASLFSSEPAQAAPYRLSTAAVSLLQVQHVDVCSRTKRPPARVSTHGFEAAAHPRCERSGPGPDRSVHGGVDTNASTLAARGPEGVPGQSSTAPVTEARHRKRCRGDFSFQATEARG